MHSSSQVSPLMHDVEAFPLHNEGTDIYFEDKMLAKKLMKIKLL